MTDTKLIKCEFTLEELTDIICAFEKMWPMPIQTELGLRLITLREKLNGYINDNKTRGHSPAAYVMDMCPPLYRCEVCGETYNENMNQECSGDETE